MKKAAIIIVLAILAPLCLFADRNFTLSHTIAGRETFSCGLVFWEISSDTAITGEKRINPSEAFARLVLSWTNSGLVGVSVGFSPLYYYGIDGTSLDSNITLDYSLTVTVPSAENPTTYTSFGGSISENSSLVFDNSPVSCKYVLVIGSTSDPLTVGTDSSSGNTPIAAFAINYSDADCTEGVYKGSVFAVITSAR